MDRRTSGRARIPAASRSSWRRVSSRTPSSLRGPANCPMRSLSRTSSHIRRWQFLLLCARRALPTHFGQIFQIADLSFPSLRLLRHLAFLVKGSLLRGVDLIALCLWLFALAVWVGLIYLSFSVMTFSKAKHDTTILQDGWLLAIVGTEAPSPPRFARSLTRYGASVLHFTRYTLCC